VYSPLEQARTQASRHHETATSTAPIPPEDADLPAAEQQEIKMSWQPVPVVSRQVLATATSCPRSNRPANIAPFKYHVCVCNAGSGTIARNSVQQFLMEKSRYHEGQMPCEHNVKHGTATEVDYAINSVDTSHETVQEIQEQQLQRSSWHLFWNNPNQPGGMPTPKSRANPGPGKTERRPG
jgi:hypothetical protein